MVFGLDSISGRLPRFGAHRLWKWFWRPAVGSTWGAIFLLGGLVSLVAFGTFTTVLEQTNTLEFCISCHSMESIPYQEFKKSPHFSNASGVDATCADCHVPKQFAPKLWRKVLAVKDIYGTLLGTIDTPEKYAAKRLEMAKTVWTYMKESDSRECRSCHSFATMDFKAQKRRPRAKHPEAIRNGGTCIDCHKGIAHNLPEDWDLEDDD